MLQFEMPPPSKRAASPVNDIFYARGHADITKVTVLWFKLWFKFLMPMVQFLRVFKHHIFSASNSFPREGSEK